MSRLTKRNEQNTGYYYPMCFEECGGLGISVKCESCKLDEAVCEKLGAYEDAEEQDLLLKLPCKTNTTVYVIPTRENGLKKIAEMELLGYAIGEPSNVANLFSKNRFDKGVPKMYQPSIKDFGITWFLTKEEAEQKLAKYKGE